MKVVFKVGPHPQRATAAASNQKEDKRTSRPMGAAVTSTTTTWRPIPTYYYIEGRRREAITNDGYQEDEAGLKLRTRSDNDNQFLDKSERHHESLVKKVRERIQQDAATAYSGAASYSTLQGSLCTQCCLLAMALFRSLLTTGLK